MSFNPTSEQQHAIDLAKTGKNLKLVAFAGAGKTATLSLIAKVLAPKKGLYLAFNRDIAQEAQEKMPENVHAQTIHSLALQSSPHWLKSCISKNSPKYDKLAAQMGIEYTREYLRDYASCVSMDGRSAKKLKSERKIKMDKKFIPYRQKVIGAFAMIRLARATAVAWYDSGDKTIDANHAIKALKNEGMLHIYPEDSGLVKSVLSAACKLVDIALETGESGKEGVYDIHSLYLKLFALEEKIVPYDFILFDEAQDANGVMLSILQTQANAGKQIIVVGDSHQQIYAWRGAKDALNLFETPNKANLTQSFRFGKNIAKIGNSILTKLGEELELTSFTGAEDKIYLLDNQDNLFNTGVFIQAILCRTNHTAIKNALTCLQHKIPFNITANTNEMMEKISVIHKMNTASEPLKEKENCEPFISRGIFTYADLVSYCNADETQEDKEVSQYLDFYLEHGISALNSIIENSKNQKGAVVITTVHKSKGLEWDNVYLAEDLGKLHTKDFDELPSEEMRLLYVAMTRAKKNLVLSPYFYDTAYVGFVTETFNESQVQKSLEKVSKGEMSVLLNSQDLKN